MVISRPLRVESTFLESLLLSLQNLKDHILTLAQLLQVAVKRGLEPVDINLKLLLQVVLVTLATYISAFLSQIRGCPLNVGNDLVHLLDRVKLNL